MFNPELGRLLLAGIVAGVLGISAFTVAPFLNQPAADIVIEAPTTNLALTESFTVDIHLTATEPVNVFTGVLTFDPDQLQITAIDYHTSVADLWAELPWYSNGDGTLTFAGGSTRPGGFVGTENIITVTFMPQDIGNTMLAMRDIRVLKHDGRGTDAELPTPLDTVLTISPEASADIDTVLEKSEQPGPDLFVAPPLSKTDLNGDGKHSFVDTSIFMTHLTTQNLRSDFNEDGVVDLADLSILNQAGN